jgi:HD-like signal output (HDOD) protein
MFKFLKRSTVDPRLQLQKALGEFSLPTFPSVVLEALDAIHDPEIDARAMAKILATDPGLTVRVLKTVNSASFSSIRKIDNIRQAVSLMGLSTLEALILSVSIADALPRVDNPCYDFADFWGAAALRATLCRSLADRICPTQRIECFTAGLLQDMALPFLVKQHPEQYAEILTTWRAGDADLAVLERQEFDWDHAEVATWLCSAWDLPEQLSICIGKHHGSMEFEGAVPLPVQLVSCIRDCRENDGLAAFEAAAREKCGFDDNAVADLVTASREAATELKQMML